MLLFCDSREMRVLDKSQEYDLGTVCTVNFAYVYNIRTTNAQYIQYLIVSKNNSYMFRCLNASSSSGSSPVIPKLHAS